MALSLGKWVNPRNQQVDSNVNAANDPKALGIVRALVHEAEDDGENNTAKVSTGTGDTRHDTVGIAMDVGDETKVGAVTCFVEDSHQEDETKHG